MAPKLYKAAEVCEMTQVQPYVLRSWEKEFPGIGVHKSGDGTRVYRQSDVEQVQRIKHLVFVEGLTLAGARRRLDEAAPATGVSEEEAAEVIEALGAAARTRIANVRDGLRSILDLLAHDPQRVDTLVVVDQPVRRAAARPTRAKVQSIASASKARSKAPQRAKPAGRGKATAKRKRASA